MKHHAYLFEAKSIQTFLLESGRLRDLVGGSELIESLTGKLLDEVLARVDPGETIRFSRRAGGAFYAFSESPEGLDALMQLWSLVVQQSAPGLQFDHARGTGENPLNAFDDARRRLRANTSFVVVTRPLAAPVALRSPRSGLPAVSLDKRSGEPADAATRAKAASADLSTMQLMDRIGPRNMDLTWRNWPRSLEADDEGGFPFVGEDRTIALVHADGNGFGELLRRAREAVTATPEDFMKVFETLSGEIRETTETAVQQAVANVLAPNRSDRGILPARPVVVGGDDLTFLVRADLALPFLQAFVSAFESASRCAMKRLRKTGLEDLPDKLTIGAGLVCMRASQPFHMALDLVEDLIQRAKRDARASAEGASVSSVVFHRVTTSLVDDYRDVLARELTHHWDGHDFIQSLGTYALGNPSSRLPDLDALIELQELLQSESMARGPTRQLLGLMGCDPVQARTRYRRWREVMAGDEKNARHLQAFDALLGRLMLLGEGMVPSTLALPYERGDEGGRSPLGDAVALMAVARPTAENSPAEEEAG
ncbi:hypothetical protein HFP89_01865 [Wenzhouxiangella sp. XN79A]|uniref:Cas10/Cmr2 second palm domain-containing protein n=1 Tax=Wenzhouxiangella sp. XN79A TaxID=2724193 RepID=UPI00144AA818|nr:hypothetical protein [Wenzhouxiangella sp. XN79A]NKI33910.1 hypothetical protein [Wenzhouxiangella sp. XN79A]